MTDQRSRDSRTAQVHVEDRLHAAAERWLRRRGWRPRVVPFTGYGTEGWVRVLARVLLRPPDQRDPARPRLAPFPDRPPQTSR